MFTDRIDGAKKGCKISDEVKKLAVIAYIKGPNLEGV
jgi:hypothetical protein